MTRANANVYKINNRIGERMKLTRITKKLRAGELAKKMEISHQQLRKYETGENRISAARLCVFSKITNQDYKFFFQLNNLIEIKESSDALSLLKTFNKMKKPETQQMLLKIAKALQAGD